MDTPTIILTDVEQAVSQVTTPVVQITQAELAEYHRIETAIEKLEADRKVREVALKQALGAGMKVEPGDFVASIKTIFRRSPSWKQKAIELADKLFGAGEGEGWAEKVSLETPPTTIVQLDVH